MKNSFVLCLLLAAACSVAGAQDMTLPGTALMHEVDSLEQIFDNRPLMSTYDKSSGILEISNLKSTVGYRMVAEIQRESEVIETSEFVLDDLESFGTVLRQIQMGDFPEWEDTFLNLYYYQGGDMVASEQILVDKKPHHRTAGGGTVRIDETGGRYIFQGILPGGMSWEAGISNRTGFLESYIINGQEWLAAPIHPCGWKPGDVSFVSLNNNGTVVVNSSKGMIIYAASGDGTMFVSMRESTCPAFTGVLSQEAVCTEYFGRGPQNCYGIDAAYGRIGRYEHDPGWAHSNMKWFKTEGREKTGLVFESDYDFMATTDTNGNGVVFSLSFMYGTTDFYIYPSFRRD